MQPPTSTAHEAEAGGSTMVRAIVAALTLVAVIFVAVGYALWFQPERPLIGTEARSDYDREAMREAMSVNSLDQRVRDILDRGDRYPGRPG